MQTNCTALAKVTVNKKLNTLRIVFSFDKYNKMTVRNAALVTGDICDVADDNAQYYIAKELEKAKQVLRCNNIAVVD